MKKNIVGPALVEERLALELTFLTKNPTLEG